MTPQFLSAWEKTLGVEGGYANRATDRGGATKYGITEQVARANGYAGAMEDLPLDEAQRIAFVQYWTLPRFDLLCFVSERIAGELFDTGYNCGVGVASRFLQRALNVLNAGASQWPDLEVDGLLGPLSVSALRSFLTRRGVEGETVLLRVLNSLQGARYVAIAEGSVDQESNVYGWFRGRVV